MLDPEKGYLVACNNKFASDNYVYRISSSLGHNSARAARATSLIKEKLE